MYKVLFASDIDALAQDLDRNGVASFYRAMENHGYGYPIWAREVSTTLGPVASVDYVRGSALMGLGSPIFRLLTSTQIDALRLDIAHAYWRVLSRTAREQPELGVVQDLDVEQVGRIYTEGLERNGLCIENWNLHFPLRLVLRASGEVALARYWAYFRDARRAPLHIGLLANLATIVFIYQQADGPDLASRQLAGAWLARNPEVLSRTEIERRMNIVLKIARQRACSFTPAFLEILGVQDHGLGSGAAGAESEMAQVRPMLFQRLVEAYPSSTSEAAPEDLSAAVYRDLIRRLTEGS
jgi:hypothetical protein